MKRRMRRRSRRKKKRNASFKRWRRRVIALSIVLGLVYLAHFMYSNLYAIVMNYASKQTINIATLIIKEAIGQSELVSFNVEDVIHFEENDKGYVSSVYINTPELNRLLVSATHQVEEKLLLVESGDLSELGLDAIYGGPYEDGVLLSVPLTAALNLSLFHEYGPRFPVSAKVIGNAVTDIVTDVKPYGINNAMLEISLKVTVRMKVTLPFKSDETVVSVASPIVIKMITGQTPEYYYIGSSSASPLSPFTNESGKTNESQTQVPDASPEQGVENGMENILLQ
ncbi:MAG: sporulation protein YunB [Turicibacter sp.]|nr:sporulation protein YunB [Turicibacter sp.]